MKAKPKFQPGDWFLGFLIVRLIGRGGIGEVYEIADKGKRCALKIIQAKWLDDPDQVRRMLGEGRATLHMKHPHVVNVHEFNQAPDGTVWMRMDLLQGSPLDVLLRTQGAMSTLRGCKYLRGAALGAHQCHILGMIHRDIKPANLFVTTDEVIKLLDLGLVKVVGSPETADGCRHGTPLYMAPEQIRGDRLTPAADVYSLGMMGHEMFTGVNPFGGSSNIHTLFHRHFEEVPEHLSAFGVPDELADVIARALRKDPRDRYPDGLSLSEALRTALEHNQENEPDSGTYPGEPPIELLREEAEGAMRFGTGPVIVRRRVAESGRFPRQSAPAPEEPRRSSPARAAVECAQTERLPGTLEVPSEVQARIGERGGGQPSGRPAVSGRWTTSPKAAAPPRSVWTRAPVTLRMGSRSDRQPPVDPLDIDETTRTTVPLRTMPFVFERDRAPRFPTQAALQSPDAHSRSSMEPSFSPVSPIRSRGLRHLSGYVGALCIGVSLFLWFAWYLVEFRSRGEPAGPGSASALPVAAPASAAGPSAPTSTPAPPSISSSVLAGSPQGSAPPPPTSPRLPPGAARAQHGNSSIVDPWAPLAKPPRVGAPPKPRQEIVDPWEKKK